MDSVNFDSDSQLALNWDVGETAESLFMGTVTISQASRMPPRSQFLLLLLLEVDVLFHEQQMAEQTLLLVSR